MVNFIAPARIPNMRRIINTLITTALALGSLNAQVVINEICASNLTLTTDNYGGYEDIIELYNTTPAVVDLSGFYLSDSQNNPLKWPIPAGTTIAGNDHLVFYCSGRDEALGGNLHTNFKLNQSKQEWVVLSTPAGVVIDDFELQDPTQTNHSWGRTTDGAPTWNIFLTPTLDAPNGGSSNYYTAKPTMSVPAGFYGGAQSVSLASTDPSATIYYTLDGSEPTTGSTVYAGPINIATTSVLRARAFSSTPVVPPSYIETNTYFINSTHTMAVLSIAGDEVDDLLNGNGGIEPTGSIEYFGDDQMLRDEAVGYFNEHGNDSWAYDQRGFDYITKDAMGYNDALDYQMFRTKGRDSYQRLIVKAAANDNYPFENGAHIRDAFVHALSHEGDLDLDERTYEPAILYVNGEYWGLYDYREKVDDHDFTRYYYDQGEYDIQFLKTWGGTWSEYGGAQSQIDWDALVAYIMANDVTIPANWDYIDNLYNWKSLVDYVVLNSYIVCADWLNWNTAWWRGLDPAGQKKKWRYVLWDMDASFGHYVNYTGVPDVNATADPCDPEFLNDPGGQGHIPILNKLMENETFNQYYIARYADLSNTVFSCDNMNSFLDSLINIIEPEMPGQIARWGGNMAGWQAEVQQLRDFIDDRCAEIETGMVDCYDLVGPFDVTFIVDPPLSGEIKVNSTWLPNYPFVGSYYGDMQTLLEAQANAGYTFGWWEYNNNAVLPSVNDSMAFTDFQMPDTIIAHFVPDVQHEVVFLTDPPGSATMQFGVDFLSVFPTVMSVAEATPYDLQVFPEQYYDFLYWEVKNNTYLPNDSTSELIEISFLSADTIIAHLEPEEYGYYVPNAFTPNGDGHNDYWLPLGNAVDVDDFNLKVFNRWGELIFETNDPFMPWWGFKNNTGKMAQDGVYAYRIKVTDAVAREEYELLGHVTLFR